MILKNKLMFSLEGIQADYDFYIFWVFVILNNHPFPPISLSKLSENMWGGNVFSNLSVYTCIKVYLCSGFGNSTKIWLLFLHCVLQTFFTSEVSVPWVPPRRKLPMWHCVCIISSVVVEVLITTHIVLPVPCYTHREHKLYTLYRQEVVNVQ